MAILGRFERLSARLSGNWLLRCYGCPAPGRRAHEASRTGTDALGLMGSRAAVLGIVAVYGVPLFPCWFSPVMITRDSRAPIS